MRLRTHLEKDYCIIELNGYLDASSSIMFDCALKEAISISPKKIFINFQHLEYISSAGLGVLISYIKDLEAKRIIMVLFGMDDKIKNVFELIGLEDLIPIVKGQDDAHAYCNNVAKGI